MSTAHGQPDHSPNDGKSIENVSPTDEHTPDDGIKSLNTKNMGRGKKHFNGFILRRYLSIESMYKYLLCIFKYNLGSG